MLNKVRAWGPERCQQQPIRTHARSTHSPKWVNEGNKKAWLACQWLGNQHSICWWNINHKLYCCGTLAFWECYLSSAILTWCRWGRRSNKIYLEQQYSSYHQIFTDQFSGISSDIMGCLTNNPTYMYKKASNRPINEIDQHNGMHEPLQTRSGSFVQVNMQIGKQYKYSLAKVWCDALGYPIYDRAKYKITLLLFLSWQRPSPSSPNQN